MSIHDEAEDARRICVMRADRTCLAHSNYTNKCPSPQCRRPLDLYVIVSTLILYRRLALDYFLAAPILEIIQYELY